MWSDPYILVAEDIKAPGGDANTRVAFKNFAPFTKFITHINDEHVDNADNIEFLCTIWLNIVTAIQTLQEAYDSL